MSELSRLILAKQIKDLAASRPDFDVATFVDVKPSGEFAEEIRTYKDLWGNGQALARGLAEAGQAKGATFAMVMLNHPEFVDFMVASSIGGNVFVPIDPRSKGSKLTYMIEFAECTGVVIGDYAWDNLKAVLPDLPAVNWVCILGQKPKDEIDGVEIFSVSDWLSKTGSELPILVKDPSEVMQLLYTSGTTGDPKAITDTYQRLGVAAQLPKIFGLTDSDRPYTGLSLTHANAQLITFGMSLYGELRCVISRKFTKSRLWDITRHYGCTVFNLLGGMTTAIYSEPRKDNDADNPVKLVISAGMPKAIWQDFQTRFGVDVFEMYGAAEGGLTFNPPGAGPIGSIGKAPPNLMVKIVDENDEVCAPGMPGEIIFQNADGSTPVVRYLKNEKATQSKTRGGWLRMGDIGYADEDGWLYFMYRSGGGIRRNGDFVNPAFVEKELAEIPVIDDVFVYGISTPKNAPGEKEVVAAIVLNPSIKFDPNDVFKTCKDRLESNFIPQFLHVVEAIPKTASEKPQERFLIEKFSMEAENVFSRSKK